jgi:iron-sulfur cluster repair protein YtfE (RIC family)
MEDKCQSIQFLKDDHKRLRGLFRQIETVDERAHVMKNGVFRQIVMEIEIHSEIEEGIFYPALLNSFQDDSAKALVSECMSDHDRVKDSLDELKSLDVYHETFNERMNDLIAEIEQHIDKEETELFVQAQQQVFSVLEQITDRMKEERQRLLQLSEYQDSHAELVQNPSGGEQKRKGRAA